MRVAGQGCGPSLQDPLQDYSPDLSQPLQGVEEADWAEVGVTDFYLPTSASLVNLPFSAVPITIVPRQQWWGMNVWHYFWPTKMSSEGAADRYPKPKMTGPDGGGRWTLLFMSLIIPPSPTYEGNLMRIVF